MALDGWLGIVIMAAFGVGFAALMIGLSALLGPRNPTPEKLAPYECGMPAVGNARERHKRSSLQVGIGFCELAYVNHRDICFLGV